MQRRPFGAEFGPPSPFLALFGLILSLSPVVSVKAQFAQHPQYKWYNDPRYVLGTPSVTPGLPGEQLVRVAVVDLYSYNFGAAIPLLEKAVRLGNSDAMGYLSDCYAYGYGVPRDLAKSRQLGRMAYSIAEPRAVRMAKERQEEQKRQALAWSKFVDATYASWKASHPNGAASSTTLSKPYKPEPMIVLTPWGPRVNAPFTSGGLYYHLTNP